MRAMFGSNDNASTVALLLVLLKHQTSRALFCANFSEISLIVTCYTFPKLKIRTLTSNNFQNQINGSLKLLDYNGNHQKGIGTQKVIALHFCGFKL